MKVENKYSYAERNHPIINLPIIMFHEVGEDMFETRKIFIYDDGRRVKADNSHGRSDVFLTPIPMLTPDDHMKIDLASKAVYISKEEFEVEWALADY